MEKDNVELEEDPITHFDEFDDHVGGGTGIKGIVVKVAIDDIANIFKKNKETKTDE
jgi:hypothetical protein